MSLQSTGWTWLEILPPREFAWLGEQKRLAELQHRPLGPFTSIVVKTHPYSRVCHFFALPTLEPFSPRRDERSPSLADLFSLFHFHPLVCPVLSLLSQPNTCKCDQLSSCITCMHTESHGCTGLPHLWTPWGANQLACRLNPSLAAWQQDQGRRRRRALCTDCATWSAIMSHQSNQSN